MKRVIVIAEAGVNHNGDINLAKQLIDVAAEAGVDFVKFQTFSADKLVSKNAKKAEYQKENTKDGDESQYQMLKNLELSFSNHYELIEYCKSKAVNFFSTAFDLDSLKFLAATIAMLGLLEIHKKDQEKLDYKPLDTGYYKDDALMMQHL